MNAGGFTELTVGRGIRCAAMADLGKIALDDTEGRSLTYAQLVERMDGVGRLAAKHGLTHGDVVALITPNCMEYPEIVAGLSEHGIVVATLNPLLSETELEAIFADCQPRLVIAAEQIKLPARSPRTVRLGSEYEAEIAGTTIIPIDTPAQETAPFAIAYTSGTTGVPKGVLLPHRSRCLMFTAMAAEYGCFGRDDHFLALAPMCHGAGFAFAVAPLYNGGRCTIAYSANPARLLAALDEHRPNGIFVVPTHLHRIFNADPALLETFRHKHALKTIISNASALAPHLKQSAVDYFGEGLLHETYGSTEGGIVTNIRPRDLLEKQRSVGGPFQAMEIQLRREDGTLAETGELGELFCRSPYSFSGYLNRPEETAETLVDGWVTVGDMAVRDADGFITIADRKKDMIVTGGINVYPREVETVIEAMDGISECAVVGEPNSEWGEALRAFIVAEPRKAPSDSEILEHCKARLAPYKLPKSITFLDELPRNATGKLMKRKLREAITQS
ncbi:MAG: class I adenylate-forming enzyme family protein [Erythrobacter sp.]